MKSRIFYTKPSIIDLEVHCATDAAADGLGYHCYAYINHFEDLFKQRLNVHIPLLPVAVRGIVYEHGRFGRRV